MIDVHTHIIPNIDDGSRSIEETFNLIKEAKEAGFDTIVSTSHYIEDYYEVENKERKVWIEAINQKLIEQKLGVTLCLGNEIYISDNIIELLESGKAATMNDTCYVLFEMPLNAKPLNLYDVIFEMLKNDLIPILAHPERYSFVQKDPDIIYDLIEKGVLMQCNYGSFIGQYGSKAEMIAKKMLLNNMVHFLGSDVHRQRTVYPRIPQILDEIKNLVGERKVEELTEINPLLALGNKKIDISEPKHLKITIKDKIKMNLNKD